MVATMALAISGPIPGMVAIRWLSALIQDPHMIALRRRTPGQG